MLSPEERARAHDLAASAKGDPLGLTSDHELAMALADAAAHRFFRAGPSLAELDSWAAVVAEVSRREDLPLSIREELGSHEYLIHIYRECLIAESPASQIRDVIQRSFTQLSDETSMHVIVGVTSLALGIAETIGRERQILPQPTLKGAVLRGSS